MNFGVLLRWLKANDGFWRRVAMPSLFLRINTFEAEDHTSIHHTTAVKFKRSTLSTSALLRSYYTLGAASQISQTSHSTHQPRPVPALTISERGGGAVFPPSLRQLLHQARHTDRPCRSNFSARFSGSRTT